MRHAVEIMPSFAPSTIALKSPMRCAECLSE